MSAFPYNYVPTKKLIFHLNGSFLPKLGFGMVNRAIKYDS